ncbi:MAG: ketoacyl-ACP synthase III [Marinilabiliaceae bacterium]|jgi:3-oxoacyl-[acyl-carrier-protein] synthase-3|nr:ketoacyl-ACP synthase III [Marinilabiliaceae bacterium]
MYITAIGHYLPDYRVPNDYFLNINGLTDDWIYERTGIKTRTRANGEDNTNTMGIKAVQNMKDRYKLDLSDVDLIIGATYTPVDTVATLAHVIQKEFDIRNARVLSVSTACSSFLNAIEIARSFFISGIASKAIVLDSEHNSFYGNETDPKAGHLWGDGSAATLICKERTDEDNPEIVDIQTKGLAHVGKGPEAVYLRPADVGLVMPDGRDVFINACTYMASELVEITSRNNLAIEDLDYVVPHQANVRIINHIAKELSIPKEKVITHIEEHGNTGSASTLIGLSMAREMNHIKKGSLMAFTVFGGGYSAGSMLLKF